MSSHNHVKSHDKNSLDKNYMFMCNGAKGGAFYFIKILLNSVSSVWTATCSNEAYLEQRTCEVMPIQWNVVLLTVIQFLEL